MASATRLPIKSIVFTTALVAAAGASHVNIQKLLTDAFTGPGSYSRIAATVVLLANLKNLPGVWHVCSPLLSLLADSPILSLMDVRSDKHHSIESGTQSSNIFSSRSHTSRKMQARPASSSPLSLRPVRRYGNAITTCTSQIPLISPTSTSLART
jgi:hypothetical protein